MAQVGALTVTAVNPTVIMGGATSLTVNVANSAPTSSDALNFTASASGSGYGLGATGSLAAASSGNFTIAGGFNSSSLAAGNHTGTITVTGTNAVLAGTALNSGAAGTVVVNVLGHSNPALSITGGNNQTVILGATNVSASLSLTDSGTNLSPLDVNTLSGLGGSSGTAVVASGGSTSYTATLSTTCIGPAQTQSFSLKAGDEQALPGASALNTLSQTVTLNVLDHSNASLSSTANQTAQTINFGNVLLGANVASQSFTIYDRAANTTAANTANLKLTGYTAASGGDTALTTNLSAFNNLPAGGSGNTFTASLNTGNYPSSGIKTVTMSASQLADDSSLPGAGYNNNRAISVTLQGNVGNATADKSNSPAAFGSPLTASVAQNASYANLASMVTSTTGSGGQGMLGSTATILAGTASAPATVSMAWRTGATNSQTGVAESLVSDVVDLTGMAVVDGQTKDGSVHTGTFVLQMSYSPLAVTAQTGLGELAAAQAGLIQINYLDLGPDDLAGTADDKWELATLGDFGGTNSRFMGVEAWNNDTTLGDWGVNVQTHLVWAVLDHNSQFAATTTAAGTTTTPEPGTLTLLAVAGIGLTCYRLRRRVAMP